MRAFLLAALVMVLASPAHAQTASPSSGLPPSGEMGRRAPPPQTQPPVPGQAQGQGLGLAIQQINNAASLFADEMQRQLAMKDARITELEKLCGDACKTKPEEAK